MIKFKKLTYKNFLSTGNEPIEIDIAANPMSLIVGTNGTGKSTAMDALTFGIYGKPFRKIKKEQILNSINRKQLLVTVEFSVGNKEYKIIRGVKPNKFEIYVDGDLKNQTSTVKEYQDSLENNILKMDEKTYRQVVMLGSSSYVPFMKLPLGDRRVVIEEILDVQIFSVMNGILKRYVANHKVELSDNINHISFLNETLEDDERILDSLNKKADEDRERFKEELKQLKITGLKLKDHKDELSELKDKFQNLVDETTNQIKNIHDKQLTETKVVSDKYHDDVKELNQNLKDNNDKIQKTYEDGCVDVNKEYDAIADTLKSEYELKQKSQHNKLEDLNNSIKTAKDKIKGFISSRDAATKIVEFYRDTHSCDSCGQDIHEDFKNDKITTSEQIINDMVECIEAEENLLKSYQKTNDYLVADMNNNEYQYGETTNEHEITRDIKLNKLAVSRDGSRDIVSKAHQMNEETLSKNYEKENLKITDTYKSQLEELTNQLEKEKGLSNDNQEKLSNVKTELSVLATEGKQLVAQIKAIDDNPVDLSIVDKVESTKKKIADAKIVQDKLYDDERSYQYCQKMLKDDGFKAQMINNYIPNINSLIRKYLDIMDFDVDFRFDNQFNETIKSNYRDTFSYANFSEGEKMRIDLCLLFAFREVAKQKNSTTTNLLIFDEIGDSSLDEDGFAAFMKIIKSESKDQNIFVISHKQEMMDNFVNVLQFTKKNMFTVLS